MKLVCALLIAIGLAIPVGVQALEPERVGQEDSLSRSIFAVGRLWLLSDAGHLSTITEGEHGAVRIEVAEPVLDVCAQNGHPIVITGERDKPKNWTLRHWSGGTWTTQTTVPTEGDALVALDCVSNRVTVLTTRRLIDVRAEGASSIHLSKPLPGALVSSTFGTADMFFVGLNAGEWGGGLRRIDRRTGKTTSIERNATGDLCGGPLNAGCDPVNGLVTEPWRPQCIVVAIGLVHMSPHGRLVEVCGDQVTRLYFNPYRQAMIRGEAPAKKPPPKDVEPFSTVAFFGLVPQGAYVLAVGIDGMYRIGQDGIAQVTPLPKFNKIGDFYVNFDLPDVVLVMSTVNQRRSLSGAVPMVISR